MDVGGFLRIVCASWASCPFSKRDRALFLKREASRSRESESEREGETERERERESEREKERERDRNRERRRDREKVTLLSPLEVPRPAIRWTVKVFKDNPEVDD